MTSTQTITVYTAKPVSWPDVVKIILPHWPTCVANINIDQLTLTLCES